MLIMRYEPALWFEHDKKQCSMSRSKRSSHSHLFDQQLMWPSLRDCDSNIMRSMQRFDDQSVNFGACLFSAKKDLRLMQYMRPR